MTELLFERLFRFAALYQNQKSHFSKGIWWNLFDFQVSHANVSPWQSTLQNYVLSNQNFSDWLERSRRKNYHKSVKCPEKRSSERNYIEPC